MVDILKYGLSVAVVGVMIVFVALVILIALITVMNKIINGASNKKKPSEQVKAAAEADPIVIKTTEVNGDEIVAAITAAIAVMMEAEGSKGGFVVRSIRRVGCTAPAWNRAGREEQVYSRM